MLRLIACLSAAFLLPATAAVPARPLAPLYDAAGVTKACEEGSASAKRTIASLEAKRGAGAIFDEWNLLQIQIEDVLNPIFLLGSVAPDKAVRDAAEPCLQKFTTLSTEIFQNEKLFARVNAASPLSPHQAKLKKDLIEGFEDTGVALPAEKRARAKAIFDKLEELRQVFERNVRDDPTKLTFTPAEMEGMSESYLKAQKRDADGNYVVGLDYPAYIPFMTNARNESARKRYYIAKLNQGSARNLDVLEEIFKLRKELAGLYGLPSFAAYSVRRKMVETPETVDKFLADVKAAVTALEKEEIAQLPA